MSRVPGYVYERIPEAFLDGETVRVLRNNLNSIETVLSSLDVRIKTTSEWATFTLGESKTIPHILGIQPSIATIQLKCVTADIGYDVGDIVDMTNNVGLSITYPNVNSLVIKFASTLNLVDEDDSYNLAAITPASWEVRVILFG